MKLALKKCLSIKSPLLVTLLLTSSFAATPAHAYLCWHDQSPQQIRDNADYVFLGKVIGLSNWGKTSSELNSTRQRITFETSSVWKGLTTEDTVVEADTEALYQYKFKKDKSYLVYGYKLYANRISLVGCPRIEDKNTAKSNIRKLGMPLFIAGEPEQAINLETDISLDDLDKAIEDTTLLDNSTDENTEKVISEEVIAAKKPATAKVITPKPAEQPDIPGFERVDLNDDTPIAPRVKKSTPATGNTAAVAPIINKASANDFDIDIDDDIDDINLEFDMDVAPEEDPLGLDVSDESPASTTTFDLGTLTEQEAPKFRERLTAMTQAGKAELSKNPKADIIYLLNTPDVQWIEIRRGFEGAAQKNK